MLVTFSGTQHKRGRTWSNLLYYILEPSKLLAPTTSFLAPTTWGILYLSVFFVVKEILIFLADSFICFPWFLVLKQVLVLPVLLQEDFAFVDRVSFLPLVTLFLLYCFLFPYSIFELLHPEVHNIWKLSDTVVPSVTFSVPSMIIH